MFKVMSKKTITNTLIIILTVIIVTISGITLTKIIKNNLKNQTDNTNSIINGELV